MEHAVINVAEAPEHIRDEIIALGTSGIHDINDLNTLSKETRAWIIEHAAKSEESAKAVKYVYAGIIRDLKNASLGLAVLQKVVGDDQAKAMNLDVYNACAAFCRDYMAMEVLNDG